MSPPDRRPIIDLSTGRPMQSETHVLKEPNSHEGSGLGFEPFLRMEAFIEEVTPLLGFRPSRAKVRAWALSGGLRHRQLPGSPALLFRMSWLVQWLEDCPVGADTPQSSIDAAHRRRDSRQGASSRKG